MPQWNLATRVAFRFSLVYLSLFCLATQILGNLFPLPGDLTLPSIAGLWPMRPLTVWTGAHIFGLTLEYRHSTGSGDTAYAWVSTFCMLVVLVWSVVDRKRSNYRTAFKWFRLFFRLALGANLLGYGIAKAIPAQMPFPDLFRLVEPFGNFSRMGVLWSQLGASPDYEIFTGWAEIVAAHRISLSIRTTSNQEGKGESPPSQHVTGRLRRF